MIVQIFLGSENDRVFIRDGLKHLRSKGVHYRVTVASIHRTPRRSSRLIEAASEDPGTAVIIGGAASATGLPGVIAGFVAECQSNIVVLGVRFDKNPGDRMVQDASFCLSNMPSGVPLGYTGYNATGFLHACILAARVVKMIEKKPK